MKKHQEPTRARIDFFHNGKLRGGATCNGYVPVSPVDLTCKFAPLTCQDRDNVMQTIIWSQDCSAKPEDVICKKKPESVASQDEVVAQPGPAIKQQPTTVPEPQPAAAEQQTLFKEGA